MSSLLCRFNALLVILAGVGLVVAAVSALLVLAEAREPGDAMPFRWFQATLSDLDALSGADQGWAYVGAALAAVAAIALAGVNLWLLLPGRGHGAGQVLVEAGPGRTLAIPRRALETALARAAREVAGVKDAAVSLRERGDGLFSARATLRLDLPPGRDALHVMDDAEERMVRAAREDFGVLLSHMEIANVVADSRHVHA